jgi:Phage Tail Collar Domain
MAYTLNFSDPGKITAITVPDMPPGVNTVDTSLALVGKGYPNFGQAIDQNFLSLLENFASPLPPTNPIEGQLWFDTSNPNNKVLRVMDGTSNAVNWASANGIYQQSTDPSLSTTLKSGDIWVNTQLSQLNIYSAGSWIPVGNAQSGEKNGLFVETIKDTTGTNHTITSTYINGNRISILAADTFIPNPIISGFSALYSGVNLASNTIFNGISVSAANLIVNNALHSAGNFLRKNDSTVNGQVITGRMLFSTPSANNQSGSQGRDGIVINVDGTASNEYIQFYKLVNNAVLLNNVAGGSIVFQTANSSSGVPNSTAVISDGVLTVNTTTSATNPCLVVNGSGSITANLTVGGSQTVSGNSSVGGSLSVANTTTLSSDANISGSVYVGGNIIPTASNNTTIGSVSKPIARLYASAVGTTSTQFFGVFNGPSTALVNSTNFVLQGQVTATNFIFTGNGSTATFNTSLTKHAIIDQVNASAPTDTMQFLVVDTSTQAVYGDLQQINMQTLRSGLFTPGMIIVHGSKIPPSGWLLCDGSSYSVATYPALANALQYQGSGSFIYGGTVPNFNVPDLSTATPVYKQPGTEPSYANYIIKY